MPFTLAWCLLCVTVACSSTPAIDEEFPPGNPVLEQDGAGDNPVVGSDGIGGEAFDGQASQDSTDYVLLTTLAICLIGAGLLLVRVERWERRRSSGAAGGG